MKKTLTSIIVLIGLISNAQSILKTAPVLFAFGNANLCYERANTPEVSYEISAGYRSKIVDEKVSAFAINFGLKAYLSKKDKPAGFYIMPSIGRTSGSDSENDFKYYDLGTLVGYQLILPSGLVFDIGAGGAYLIRRGESNSLLSLGNGLVASYRLAAGYVIKNKKQLY
jgi:hypothetical protein